MKAAHAHTDTTHSPLTHAPQKNKTEPKRKSITAPSTISKYSKQCFTSSPNHHLLVLHCKGAATINWTWSLVRARKHTFNFGANLNILFELFFIITLVSRPPPQSMATATATAASRRTHWQCTFFTIFPLRLCRCFCLSVSQTATNQLMAQDAC